jgi:hypothetical protein
MEKFMKYAVEMGSGAMTYVPSFIKIGSGIRMLIGGGDLQTHSTEIAKRTLGKQPRKGDTNLNKFKY